jgi:hypothetical protein
MATSDGAPTRNDGIPWVALLLAVAAIGVMVVLAAMDHDGAAWVIQPILGLAAAAAAWRAGGTSPRNPLAFAALIVGILMVVIFLGYLIAEA